MRVGGVNTVLEKNAVLTESVGVVELAQLVKAATVELASVTETATEENVVLMLVVHSVGSVYPDKSAKTESVLEIALLNVSDLTVH
jgi:hypothetical protein